MENSKIDKPDHQYSGDNSKPFWKRVKAIPYSDGQMALYLLGCALQDVEGRMIQALHDAEEKQARSRKVA